MTAKWGCVPRVGGTRREEVTSAMGNADSEKNHYSLKYS